MTKKLIGITVLILAFLLAACQGTSSQEDQTGDIIGGVFCDVDGDGECDCEGGFPDIRIHLYADSCGGQIVQSVTTDTDGRFSFPDLAPGDYCVFADVTPLCGGEAGLNLTAGISREITVVAGGTHEIIWFGLTPLMQSEGND